MVLREDNRTHRPVGRHGRPKPVGGRFRLPTLRFSGAAMAMSTVVGISLLTTWLLNEQQQVGRQPRMSVGASPPLPSPEAPTPTAAAEPVAAAAEAGPEPTATATATATQAATALPGSRPGSTARPVTVRPSGTPSRPPVSPGPSGSGSGSAAAAKTGGSPSPEPTGPASPVAEPTPPNQAAPSEHPDTALTGTAELTPLGRSGTRHTVTLTVREPLTAVQVELRLRRPDVLPGTAPWTDLPGAVPTVSLEYDSLVYRFTLPPGLDVAPGVYGFTVGGAVLPAGTAARTSVVVPAAESWSASAFALQRPRAVAARGAFEPY
ncbi:hypothetical protein [Kitasatospora sp. NPDC088346]|uniref:hypothetical protein n=1 Tax=Kitasatospora sp. NPDC088346 TaxID=3364073 RepID=UPI00380FF26B